MINIKFNSIANKLFFFISILLITGVIAVSLTTYYSTKKRLYEQLELEAYTIAEGLNYSIEGLLKDNDINGIYRMILNIAVSKNVDGIWVINRENKILADSVTFDDVIIDYALVSETIKREKDNFKFVRAADGQEKMIFVQPLRGSKYFSKYKSSVLGVVYLVLDASSIKQNAIDEFYNNTIILIIMMLLAFIYIVFVSRILFIKPIKSVEKYSRLIMEGNHNVAIPIYSNDELGHLSAHLNIITKNMANTNSYLNSIIASIPNALLVTDIQGIIKMSNNASHHLTGYDENELLVRSIQSLIILRKKKGSKIDKQNIDNYLMSNRELNLRTKSGKKKCVLISSSYTKNAMNVRVGIIFVIQDLTERKNMEAKILEAKENIILSRQAGMSEIATSVLHNMGNVLNSVNVSINMLKEIISTTQMDNIKKVSSLLKDNEAKLPDYLISDTKGKLIIPYIIKLSEKWDAEQQQFMSELSSLNEQINHINQIVAMQNSFAGIFGVIEPVNLVELMDAAVKIGMIDVHANQITVERNFQKIEPILLDRGKALQILINLIKNATHALLASDNAHKRLCLSIKLIDQDTVEMQISDNGIGISQENMPKIFSYGFTNKSKGHGFGLHSCIFTAKELNGSLRAYSAGLNQGATFTLTLPYRI